MEEQQAQNEAMKNTMATHKARALMDDSANSGHSGHGMGALSFLNAVDEDKRTKQERYRRDLEQQMAAHHDRERQKEKSSSAGPLGRGPGGFTAALPTGSGGDGEEKRAKQERYRRDLEDQMKAHRVELRRQDDREMAQQTLSREMKERRGSRPGGAVAAGQMGFYELKEAEEPDEGMKQHQYAMQLEEQMRLRKLTEVAEKERQLLEDRKMLIGGGFLDGFGKNPLPRVQIQNKSHLRRNRASNRIITR